MIFHPQSLIKTEGSFVFSGEIHATAHPCLNKDIIKAFWYNFTFQSATLGIRENEEFIFSIGSTQKIPLDGYTYSINIDANGVCIFAKNEKELLHGFMTLLDRFQTIDHNAEVVIALDCCQIKDKPTVQTRMVHFCIFPETELWQLQRFVRFCGALKYTHIILEFWGMLKYDCLKELSWSHGFTKEQICPIIREAKDLGMQVIPMFNHWGHASSSRIMHGKHVVLDQNPRLQPYFSDDGWCWDIKKEKVKELFRKIRAELCELCGDGDYFHIGCDEADNYEQTPENLKAVCDFINGISDEMRLQNRRVIVWGDMFLYRHPHYNPANKYSCSAATPEAEQFMLEHISRDVLIADWQYSATQAPIETAAVFQKAGFDCLLCPWDKGDAQLNAVLTTVREEELMGFIHTTWHTLSKGMDYVMLAAVRGYGEIGSIKPVKARTSSAALLRKVMPIHGDYRKSGWSSFEVDYLW